MQNGEDVSDDELSIEQIEEERCHAWYWAGYYDGLAKSIK